MKRIKKYILLLFLVLPFLSVIGQDLQERFSLQLSSVAFPDLMETLQSESGTKFFYREEWYTDRAFTLSLLDVSLDSALYILSENFGIHATRTANGMVYVTGEYLVNTDFDFITRSSEEEAGGEENITGSDFIATSSLPQSKLYVFGSSAEEQSYTLCRISGQLISESKTDVPVGATIYFPETGSGFVSDADGYFSFEVLPGRYLAEISCIGFNNVSVIFEIHSRDFVKIPMFKELMELDEVTITARKNNQLTEVKTGYEAFSVKQVKNMPVLLGEKDIIQSIKTVPGVKTVGEGNSGLYVRGGNMDQNMVYYNQVPIYNTSHMTGFISAFNSNVISDFALYKSSIPVEYGGKLSSVIEVEGREGDYNRFGLKAGISPISANIAFETPIIRDKLSVIAGFRKSYSNYLLEMIDVPMINESEANFQDFTTLLNYRPNDKNSIDFFVYYSDDELKLATFNHYNYSNLGGSMIWKRRMSSALNSELIASVGDYSFDERNSEVQSQAYFRDFSIRHFETKYSVNWAPGRRHLLKGGVNGKLYMLDRGSVSPLDEYSNREYIDMGEDRGLELAIFLSDEIELTPWLKLYGGLRYSLFYHLGPATVYDYADGLPMDEENVTDSTLYGPWEKTASYNGPEIRLAANFRTGAYSSFKLAYNQSRQYLFMLSNTIAVTPVDQWKLVDSNINPLYGTQYTLGYYKTFPDINLVTSLETYYKHTRDLPEFMDGVNLIESKYVERDILQGMQEAYGLEVMLSHYGKVLDMMISYSYSRSIIEVPSLDQDHEVNAGEPFPSNYDQPHMLNMNGAIKMSKRINIAANMVYSSGRPITYPSSMFYLNGVQYIEYSERNEYRLPDYFRIDLSLNVEGNLKRGKLAHSSWSFGVYNATGRKNAYSLYFAVEDGAVKGYKLSIIGVPVFTATWQIKLGNYNSD